MNEQFVLITGSPMTGFVMTGPFPSREEAIQYAVNHGAPLQSWWVAPLFTPKE